MDTLSMHVEYLLRDRDCVVLPGFGAFICDNRPASFDCVGETLLPPGRRLAFNPLINRNDGLLATSIARRESIPFEAASKKVAERIAHLRGELQREQQMQFGRLGQFMLNPEGMTAFVPTELAGINGAYFGLKPIDLKTCRKLKKRQKPRRPPRQTCAATIAGVGARFVPTHRASPLHWPLPSLSGCSCLIPYG